MMVSNWRVAWLSHLLCCLLRLIGMSPKIIYFTIDEREDELFIELNKNFKINDIFYTLNMIL